MNAADAMNAARRVALNRIDGIAVDPLDPAGACEEIRDITGNLIGDLARAGFSVNPG